MDQLKETFEKFRSSAFENWNKLSGVKKGGIAAVALGIVVSLSLLTLLSKEESYEYLFVNLSAEDSTAISVLLKKQGMTDFIIDNKGIKVKESSLIQYRLQVTQDGLPTHGQVGWEKFDDPDFTRTEFERRIHRLRAIQGELARTITGIEGISSARVHIVTPKKQLFEKDRQEPTAAVYIKTKRGVGLTSRQIKGIVHMVSRSVEGMHTENISIIDFEGKLLTEEPLKDATAKVTKHMSEYKRSYEKKLEEKVRAIVGRIVGQDRVEARIEVDLDFTKEEQTISDVNPDKVVVISQNTTAQKMEGNGLNPTGIPGSKSNVPGEQEALNLSMSKAQNSRDSELVNYEIAKTISHKILPSAVLQRISAAVIVDGKQVNPIDGSMPKFEAREKEEMGKITELVKSAIGFKPGRDEVKVHNLLFQLDYTQVEALNVQNQEKREYISTLAIASVVAFALILFFGFIVRPYFRWLSYNPERKAKQAIVEEFQPDLELGGVHNVQVKEDVPFDKLTPQEQVIYLAKHEPQRTTEAIRILLNPHSTT